MSLVTIIIPTYNRLSFLKVAINSVMIQTYRPLELIVVDDGSKDGTKEYVNNIIKSSDIIVKYIYQENAGAQKARNAGIRNSNGAYIQFLDSDDFLHKNKIGASINEFDENKNIDMVYCKRGDYLDECDIYKKYDRALADLEVNCCADEVIVNGFWTALPIIKREVIDETVVWDEELTCHQDYVFLSIVASKCKAAKFIDQVLAYCRVHKGDRISTNNSDNPKSIFSYYLSGIRLMPFASTMRAKIELYRRISAAYCKLALLDDKYYIGKAHELNENKRIMFALLLFSKAYLLIKNWRVSRCVK